MKAGDDLLITASMEKRVENIYLEYIRDIESDQANFIDRVLESLTAIKKYIIKKAGKDSYFKLLELAKKAEFKELTKILLEEYYDPMYEHSQNKINNYKAQINADNIRHAAQKIVNIYQI
jgi:tRNA 2-selenouridine synthase